MENNIDRDNEFDDEDDDNEVLDIEEIKNIYDKNLDNNDDLENIFKLIDNDNTYVEKNYNELVLHGNKVKEGINNEIELKGVEDDMIIREWKDLYIYFKRHGLPYYVENNKKKYCELEWLKEIIKLFAYNYGAGPRKLQQILAIKLCIGNRHMIVQEETGSGKTATYLLGSLLKINKSIKKPQIFILAPTRILVDQIMNNILNIVKDTGITVNKYYSGSYNDNEKISYDYHIVVCTLGKLYNLCYYNRINLNYFHTLILDEGDKILIDTREKNNAEKNSKENFRQIQVIVSKMLEIHQIWYFSATIEGNSHNYCIEIMKLVDSKGSMIDINHDSYLLKKENEINTKILQYYVICSHSNVSVGVKPTKNNFILKFLEDHANNIIIIFFNKIETLNELSELLTSINKLHLSYHGQMDHIQQNEIKHKIINNQFNILLSTDICGRGIDNKLISVVINYEMPNQKQEYIHRIGRSGRGNITGHAITLMSSIAEYKKLNHIVKWNKPEIVIEPFYFKQKIK